MSRHDPVQSSAEAKLALWGELTAAFAQKGQLLPTSPSEVFEVELSGVAEVQLPEQLRELSFKVEPNSESLGAPATIRHKSVGALKPAPAGQQALEGYKQGELEVCVRPHTGSEMCAPIDSGPAAQIHPTKWATLSTALATRAFASGINVRLHWRDVSEPLATAGTWRQNVKISARSLCRGLLATIVNPRNDAVFGTVSLVFDDAH